MSQEEAEKILDDVWKYLRCGKPKPEVVLQRQHPTARYCPNKIEIRQDSFTKMPKAERKLVLLHEGIHACGVPHQPGFRTAIDTLSNVLYENIWGKDEDYMNFKRLLSEKVAKIRGQKEKLDICIIDNLEEL